MPYNSVDELPASVKKRIKSPRKRRQWMHVFNSTLRRTKDEGRAFAAANAVVSRKEDSMATTRTVYPPATVLTANKAVQVTLYTGIDDPDLPDHVKAMPAGVRTRWIGNYNWAAQDLMDDDAAEERADEYTSMSVQDLIEAGLLGTIKEAGDGANDDEDESDDAGDGDDLVEAAEGELDVVQKAELTAKKRGSLRRSQFAYVDAEGKGHLPIHDAAHVRNAMARMNQTDMPASAKAGARRKIKAAAKRMGIKTESFKEAGADGGDGVLVKPAPSLMQRLMAAKEGFVNGGGVLAPRLVFDVYKSADGEMRALMVYSNIFEDKQSEIFATEAHKEYEAWVESPEGAYPEFHYWHGGPDTRWGVAQHIAFTGGFAIAGGVVDPGKEHVALKLKEKADKGELAVSHGCVGLRAPDGVYLLYRTFEISPLPIGREANPWTSIDLLEVSKENGMPFNDAKKKAFKEVYGMSDEAIIEAERKFDAMTASLQGIGVAWRENPAPPSPPPAPQPNPPAPPSPAPQLPPPNPAQAAAVAPTGDATLLNTVVALAESMKGLADTVTALKQQVEAQATGTQAAAENMVLAKIAAGASGAGPANSSANLVKKEGVSGDDDNFLDAALAGVLGHDFLKAVSGSSGAGAGVTIVPAAPAAPAGAGAAS